MSIPGILAAAVGAFAILGAGLVIAADGESQTAGAPLSKEEYQQQAFYFGNKVSKARRLYAELAIDPLPRAKCGAHARKYHGKLSAILNEASALVPPAEIAEVHAKLVAGARHIVRAVARIAKRAQSERLVCGYDLEHPATNEVGPKVEQAYYRSGFDPALNRLYELGYLLGGD